MHKPRFHPEVLSFRSADLLSVSCWLSEAEMHVLLVVWCWVFHQNWGVCSGHCSGLGQAVWRCLCGSPGRAAQCPGLLLVLAELAQPWGGEDTVPTLYPCCNLMGSCSVSLLLSPAQDRVVPPAVLPAAAHHSSCLEFRNLLQLRNVFFCVALTSFANHC